MTTLSILRNALKLNAAVICGMQVQAASLKHEAKAWKEAGELSYYVDTNLDRAKLRKKLAKAVEMQRRIKVEIAAIFRNERITRKYLAVFGKLPVQQLTTSVEQEVMLDRLLSERVENPCVTIVAE